MWSCDDYPSETLDRVGFLLGFLSLLLEQFTTYGLCSFAAFSFPFFLFFSVVNFFGRYPMYRVTYAPPLSKPSTSQLTTRTSAKNWDFLQGVTACQIPNYNPTDGCWSWDTFRLNELSLETQQGEGLALKEAKFWDSACCSWPGELVYIVLCAVAERRALP